MSYILDIKYKQRQIYHVDHSRVTQAQAGSRVNILTQILVHPLVFSVPLSLALFSIIDISLFTERLLCIYLKCTASTLESTMCLPCSRHV